MNAPPITAIIGRSGAGKTTLIERLIPELKRRGWRVGTIKHHAHPGFEIDIPGKDTWRHAQAGSDHVVISAPDKIASIRTVPAELPIEQIAALMSDVDIILTDGYRRAPVPRIEVVRAALSTEPIASPADLIAVAADFPLAIGVPRLDLNDPAAIADFIETHSGLRRAAP
jgi:molybdopterin-guanine dinucleotide biosynthesis protein B